MCLYPVFIPKTSWHTANGVDIFPGIEVPCGKCPECLKHRQDEWFTRFAMEADYWRKVKSNSYTVFFTLTYAPEFLPDTRERSITDIQNFRKNLNKNDFKRYYIIQEFGAKFNRVHFHGLLFGVAGDITSLYRLIDKCWCKGRTNCQIVRSPAAYRYVGGYVTKQSNYANDFKEPWKPYTSCSQRPALGTLNITSQLKDYLSATPSQGLKIRSNGNIVEPRSWKGRLRDGVGQLDRRMYLLRERLSKGINNYNVHRTPLEINNILARYEERKRNYLRKKDVNDMAMDYNNFKDKINRTYYEYLEINR